MRHIEVEIKSDMLGSSDNMREYACIAKDYKGNVIEYKMCYGYSEKHRFMRKYELINELIYEAVTA